MDMLGAATMIPIQSAGGEIVYRLYCSSRLASGEPAWLTAGDNFGADFDCLLTDTEPGKTAPRATLLNYDPQDPSPYHFNLGSFAWSELLGINCWKDPQWGADRTFLLRAIRLRIRVVVVSIELYDDKKQNQTYPIIRTVTAKIEAQPDDSAMTELVQKPARLEPAGCKD